MLTELVASLTYSGVDRSLALRSFSRFDVERDSTYTETPSPKVDGAWHRLGLKSSTFILPADLGAQYGLDPQRFQYVKKGVWHKEREGYPVVLQALHDLHCVVSREVSMLSLVTDLYIRICYGSHCITTTLTTQTTLITTRSLSTSGLHI